LPISIDQLPTERNNVGRKAFVALLGHQQPNKPAAICRHPTSVYSLFPRSFTASSPVHKAPGLSLRSFHPPRDYALPTYQTVVQICRLFKRCICVPDVLHASLTSTDCQGHDTMHTQSQVPTRPRPDLKCNNNPMASGICPRVVTCDEKKT